MKARYLVVAAMAALLVAAPAQASVKISASPTKNMNCTGGVCSPTAKNAVLNTTDLTNMLATGDVKVVTGSGAVTITVSGPFTWTSMHRLTLDAFDTVSFRAPVEVAGQGAVTIITNDGGTGGDLVFFEGGKLDFWDTSSSLTINGNSYILANDLQTLASTIVSDERANVALVTDYDAAPDGTYADAAVTTDFDGTFEGLGHTISNFSASGGAHSDLGLFSDIGRIFHSASLRDVHLFNAHVWATGNTVGGGLLVGNISGSIVNASTDGVVSGLEESVIGGLAGGGWAYITRSSSSATVTAGKRSYAGGLVGYAVGDSFTFSSTISYSHASGNVTTGPRSFSGGLVGFLDIFSVFQSYATGNVVSTKPNRWGTFGGLSGGLGQYANINDTYSTGYVSTGSTSWMGGYAGYSQAGHIGTSYSIGQVRNGFPAGRAPPPAQAAVGGFIGRFVSGGATLDYWDVDTSGYAKGCDKKCSGVQGLSDAQLKSQLPAGFDPTIWGQNPSVNNGYPYLLANPPS